MIINSTTIAEAAELRSRIHDHMLQTRGGKYRTWLHVVSAIRHVAHAGEYLAPLGAHYFDDAAKRIEIIDTLYAILRIIDDFVDGDAPLPPAWKSSAAYVEHLMEATRGRSENEDPNGRLLDYVFALGNTLDMNLRAGVTDILQSLHFDALRRNSPELLIFNKEELEHHFHILDIRGTVGLWLILLRERSDAFPALGHLGEAARIYYNIRDLREDMRARLCNIPRESFETFAIPMPHDFSDHALAEWCALPQVRAWRIAEARQGARLFNEYLNQKATLQLHVFTNGILKGLFEISTGRGLRSFQDA